MVSKETVGRIIIIYFMVMFVATVTFIVLKVNNTLTWNGAWILSPFWGGLGLFVLIFFGKWIHFKIAISRRRRIVFEKKKEKKIEEFLNRR